MDIDIRPTQEHDFPVIRHWIDTRLFRRFTKPIDDSQLENLLSRSKDGNLVDYGICAVNSGSNAIVGFAHAVIDWKNELAHIQQIIVGNSEFKKCGVGTTLMQNIFNKCFNELKLNRTQLFVNEDNAPAVNFYRKLGFHTDGLMREATKFEDCFISWYCMSLLKKEWEIL